MKLETPDLVAYECPFDIGDLVTYDYEGKVGFTGTVEDVHAVWIVTVKHKDGGTLVAPVSRWKKKEEE